MDNTKILNVKKDVEWIGVLDPTLVTFDVVMETGFGTTYNSYFINADKKTILETSKAMYKKEYLDKVKRVVNPEEIEYIIMNHTEPDHSGCLNDLLDIAPNATVVATKIGIKFLKDITNRDFKYIEVADGDTLDLGNKTLKFITAPFLHWPDTMYTYLEEEAIMFTCDSFGCHYCDEKMFDDLVGDFSNAFEYYYDVIMSPYSEYAIKAIDKIKNLNIDIIATGHGPILRGNWEKWVKKTREYAERFLDKKISEGINVFIPYVSAYGNTEKMAEMIAKSIRDTGDIEVKTLDVQDLEPESYVNEIEKADAIIIGSPTITQNTFPQIYKIFGAINPVTNRGKICGSFGSYGWSGEGVEIVQSTLKLLKLKPLREGLKVVFVPKGDKYNECIQFGKEVGEKLLEKKSK